MTKIELYDDVIEEDPGYEYFKDHPKKYKAWEKRLHNSVGWFDLAKQDMVFIEERKGKQPKIVSTPLGEEKIVYDIRNVDSDFTCKDEEHAQMLSLLFQINVRLKRIEHDHKNNLSEVQGKTKLSKSKNSHQ